LNRALLPAPLALPELPLRLPYGVETCPDGLISRI
jgi:hypothetical protein